MNSLYQFETNATVYKPLRVAYYPRVSRDEQAGEDKASIDKQIADMDKVAKEKGWVCVGVCKEDCSGSIPFRERPKGSEIMAMVENDELDLVMLWDNDRLGRD